MTSRPGPRLPRHSPPRRSRPPTQPASPEPDPATQPDPTLQSAKGKLAVPPVVTLQDAILLGLQNNTYLAAECNATTSRFSRTNEQIQRAAFDPTVSGSINGGRSKRCRPTASPARGRHTYTDQINAQLAVQEFLPTGTTISAQATTGNAFYSDAGLQQQRERPRSRNRSSKRGVGCQSRQPAAERDRHEGDAIRVAALPRRWSIRSRRHTGIWRSRSGRW